MTHEEQPYVVTVTVYPNEKDLALHGGAYFLRLLLDPPVDIPLPHGFGTSAPTVSEGTLRIEGEVLHR